MVVANAEPVLVIIVLLIVGAVNLVQWLGKKARESSGQQRTRDHDRSAGGPAGRPHQPQDPGEILKRFLEEMAGVPGPRGTQRQRHAPARPPQVPPRPRATARPQPLATRPAAARRELSPPEAQPAAPSTGLRTLSTRFDEPTPSQRPVLAESEPAAVARPGKGQSAASRLALNHLPPLQRAIVLSEILRKPRALRPHGPR